MEERAYQSQFYEEQRSFSSTVRKEALKRAGYRCQNPQCTHPINSDNTLTLHHNYVWDYEAKRYKIPASFVACVENAVVLCVCCHREFHRGYSIREVDQLLVGVAILGNLTEQQRSAKQIQSAIRRTSARRN